MLVATAPLFGKGEVAALSALPLNPPLVQMLEVKTIVRETVSLQVIPCHIDLPKLEAFLQKGVFVAEHTV